MNNYHKTLYNYWINTPNIWYNITKTYKKELLNKFEDHINFNYYKNVSDDIMKLEIDEYIKKKEEIITIILFSNFLYELKPLENITITEIAKIGLKHSRRILDDIYDWFYNLNLPEKIIIMTPMLKTNDLNNFEKIINISKELYYDNGIYEKFYLKTIEKFNYFNNTKCLENIHIINNNNITITTKDLSFDKFCKINIINKIINDIDKYKFKNLAIVINGNNKSLLLCYIFSILKKYYKLEINIIYITNQNINEIITKYCFDLELPIYVRVFDMKDINIYNDTIKDLYIKIYKRFNCDSIICEKCQDDLYNNIYENIDKLEKYNNLYEIKKYENFNEYKLYYPFLFFENNYIENLCNLVNLPYIECYNNENVYFLKYLVKYITYMNSFKDVANTIIDENIKFFSNEFQLVSNQLICRIYEKLLYMDNNIWYNILNKIVKHYNFPTIIKSDIDILYYKVNNRIKFTEYKFNNYLLFKMNGKDLDIYYI